LCLFLFMYYSFVYINTVRQEDIVTEHDSRVSSIQKEVNKKDDQIESGEMDKDDRDYTLLKKMLNEEKEKLKASKAGDWEAFLTVEIEHDEPFTKSRLNQEDWATLSVWPSLFTEVINLEKMKWMRDKRVVPVFPVHIFSELTA